ncbi:MAG: DMT family transporter [Candidatus Thorarchaeota archaeon]|nr:DMT family transporter [Candidatus Thorarchaeota archaeon]
MPEKPLVSYALLIFAMLVWGGSWVSAKIAVAIAPPLTIGFFRFLFATSLFLLFMPAMGYSLRQMFSRSNLKWYALLGLTGVFGYGVFFLFGMGFTTAAQGALIAGLNPASVSIAAHIIHKEQLAQKWRYSGFILAFLGIIFVIGAQVLLDFRIEYLIGNLLIVCAMLTWGFYSSIGKAAMKSMSSMEATAGGVMVGTLLFGVGAAAEGFWTLPAMYDWMFWMNTFFLGCFVTFLGFLFYFDAINKLGATRTGVFINLVPIFGVSLSVLILNEAIHWTFLIGLALVIIGIVIINGGIARVDGL